MKKRAFALLLALLIPAGLASHGAAEAQGERAPKVAPKVPMAAAQVLRRLPHDPHAYTEGLFIHNGQLFESTGMEGRSSLRRVDLNSGRVLEKTDLPRPLFGEGIAPWRDQILMLTWRDGLGFRFTRAGFRPIGRFTYLGEGWGMTARPDGAELIMSDGSNTLRFIDPATFRTRRMLSVTADGIGVDMLNELEWVNGEILANVWMTSRIARIDPATGRVKGWIDLAALAREAGATGPDQVANGIAWDAVGKHLYVTGKEWPVMFEIAPPAAAPPAH
ncbi:MULTISPECIES: glutaminyl-peptide cyclotransferase [unclassified Novosphingobium]|uniref:glutaminyl-peptide cyclotransferase n=1 Tax=unclassified Novosphingobium TaxID=2644732 RepID=UPI000A55B095|nr:MULTISPECIES: glutaminyl-peptide cyclotransferase [unclassified Novosphingobium]MBN9142976.1 glutaminyl-peptide cyclotransferase [Novosphingobium sp.]MDR6706061.1 glutaminyl-peptide cyclotransferase [Novosphingobium sp. 1748]